MLQVFHLLPCHVCIKGRLSHGGEALLESTWLFFADLFYVLSFNLTYEIYYFSLFFCIMADFKLVVFIYHMDNL